MIFTWQQATWERLLGRLDRLPHALLLAGPAGGGKADFAQALAARLLCEQASGTDQACGKCAPCNWFATGNHPDFRLIEPGGESAAADEADTETDVPVAKKKSEQIRIDQVRALEDFLSVGTHRHGARIVILRPAEAMNPATANALLKMLEEPTASTLFFIISHNQRRLLPTIRSRCQLVPFPKPPQDQVLAWLRASKVARPDEMLAHAGGMPLAATTEATDVERLDAFIGDLGQIERSGPVTVAGRWENWLKEDKERSAGLDKRTLVTWLQKWVFDLVSVKLSGQAFYHGRRLPELRAAAARASVPGLIDCYNELLRIKAVAQHPLNPRLFLEDMLSRYVRAVGSGR